MGSSAVAAVRRLSAFAFAHSIENRAQRTKRGRPTYKRLDGTWSAGVGVRYRKYQDRFGYSKRDEFMPWKTVTASKETAPLATLLKLDMLPSASCLIVTRRADTLPAATVQIVVPVGTDPASLPTSSPATVLARTAGCPNPSADRVLSLAFDQEPVRNQFLLP